MNLQGHVGRVSKFLIAGWALCRDDPAHRPVVSIIQGGRAIHSLIPSFETPTLRSTLKLPAVTGRQMYGWRLWMPLANGLEADVPFSVVFADDGTTLTRGAEQVLKLFDGIDEDIFQELSKSLYMFPSYVRNGDEISIKIGVEYADISSSVHIDCDGKSYESNLTEQTFLGKSRKNFAFKVRKNEFSEAGAKIFKISVIKDGEDAGPLRTVSLPAGVFDFSQLLAPVPNDSNIQRVSGPSADQTNYLIGGLTTFCQLDALLQDSFGKRITDYPSVVDWGVGCARVTRHFWESAAILSLPSNSTQSILGLDIDPVNVKWCQDNMDDMGRYELVPKSGFQLGADTVDLLYGISVFTHLSEYHQFLWLSEIRRVLKSGGVAIVTVHGEASYYRSPASIPLPFVEKFGFFDGVADSAIGEDMDTYYRATSHSRKYLLENWSAHLDVVKIVPMTNAFRQDYVVLQKR